MTILNIGCGTKVSTSDRVINVDWSPYLRLKRSAVGRVIAPIVLRGERRARFDRLGRNVLVHDLSKGIPFQSGSVDVVYHSHFLEHIDRAHVSTFLDEVHRVLRPAGIHRIVVPDLEAVCRSYLAHIERCDRDPTAATKHDAYVAAIIEQSVRRESAGTSQQRPVMRFVENALLGDARRRGETHQWMYDRINLTELLRSRGFRDPEVRDHRSSAIDGWEALQLDLDGDGNEYKPGSLYIECRR